MRTVQPDHYQVLGVGRDADAHAIKSAYRKLAAAYHPDRNSSPTASQNFIAVQNAYEVLRDAERRTKYDEFLKTRTAPARAVTEVRTPEPPAAPKGPKATAESRHQESAPEMLRLTSLLAKGRISDAERLAHRLIRQYPRAAIPYAVLGDVYRFRGDIDQAIKMMSYAAQLAPNNPQYMAKAEQLIRSQSTVDRTMQAPSTAKPLPLWTVVFVVVCGCSYVALARELPFLTIVPLINTWTLGLIGMLALSGLTAGAAMRTMRVLDPYAHVHGSAVARMSPAVSLAALSAINFWIATIAFSVLAIKNDTMHRSLARLIGAVALMTVTYALASGISTHISAVQTLLWGGNLIYMAALLGWAVADALGD